MDDFKARMAKIHLPGSPEAEAAKKQMEIDAKAEMEENKPVTVTTDIMEDLEYKIYNELVKNRVNVLHSADAKEAIT